MKYSLLLTILFLVLSWTSTAQDTSCEDFKTGDFYILEYKGNRIDTSLVIKRTLTTQKEYILKDGEWELAQTLKVIWISDCKYILRAKSVRHPSNKPIKGDVIVKVVDTSTNYYDAQAWLKGKKKKKITFRIYKR